MKKMKNLLRDFLGINNYVKLRGIHARCMVMMNNYYQSPKVQLGISDGFVCLDIGANVGRVSNLIAKTVGKSGHVYSFEPDRHAFYILKAACAHIPNITVKRAALGPKSGMIPIGVTEKIGQPAVGTDVLLGSKLSTHSTKIDMIEVMTIDQIENQVRQIDFIKLDVDGNELDVLAGGIETLKEYKPIVFCEIGRDIGKYGKSGDDFFKFFASLGYTGGYTRGWNIYTTERTVDKSLNYFFWHRDDNRIRADDTMS